MNTQNIKLLIGDNTAPTMNTAYQLIGAGWNVTCIENNPLEVQIRAVSENFDAVVIFSDTGYSDTLCKSIKKYVPDCLMISVGIECGADISLRPPLSCAAIYNTVAARFEMAECVDIIQNAKDLSLHNKISKIISGLCITPRYNGYNYLREAIKIAVAKENGPMGISKHIYPEIAKRCSASVPAVERGIRTAIQRGWSKCALTTKVNFFGNCASHDDWVPTNGEFIFVIADRLNCDMSATGTGI